MDLTVEPAFRPVELRHGEATPDTPLEQLSAWQDVLNDTAEALAQRQPGTLLVCPGLNMAFFLAQQGSELPELWCTDWDQESGPQWDSFTLKACDRSFRGDSWAQHFTDTLRRTLNNPHKELEFVPGLRVVLRPSLVATLAGSPVTLLPVVADD